MPLGPSSVLDIAHLARLHLSDDDVQRYAGELSAILAFIEQMNTVDTSGVVPMAHPLGMTQPLRADVVTEPDRRDEYQANAPAVRDGLYLVPKVIP
jgi:aspartyl-tRNA(Asn)/glutamyl-tRNA(Gln) amidotransferase subunit C